MSDAQLTLGAIDLGNGRCQFRVWAPEHRRMEVLITSPARQTFPLHKRGGYHETVVEGVAPGARYLYRLDGSLERPDPASRFQPEGVHHPSQVTPGTFDWSDAGWFGLPLRDYVVYELHVGTLTEQGTFDAVIPHLGALRELGITALELMPVAQFPGGRNWGYDGVYPFAVQNSYGGPDGLKRLVDASHRAGLAVVLDVVYNHLGPEGNYLGDFAPYFTDRYRTPWGRALNFDGPHSDEVRRYFIENALCWQTEYHVDALRLDAVHAICDFSPTPFLEELAAVTHRQSERLNRRFHLIAESDMNMARHILPRNLGGYGLDGQWSDDFHHNLHVLLTGEQNGYYADFGGVARMAKIFREGYGYTGEYSPYRKHRHGSSPGLNPVKQFVVCSQNHDQVGNRMMGDRLSASLDFASLKLAAGVLGLSPFVPMLFMGEEYGETAPFQYFVSHSDPGLVEAVRKGRAAEFAAFQWKGAVPDPQDEATFNRSKLDHTLASKGSHQILRDLYRELFRLRRELPALANVEKETFDTLAHEPENALEVRYRSSAGDVIGLFSFSEKPAKLRAGLADGSWRILLDSASRRWGGADDPGRNGSTVDGGRAVELAARSFLVLQRRTSE